MKTFLFAFILFFIFSSYAFSADENVSIKATTTGLVCGKVIKISVINNGQTDYYLALNPVMIRIPGYEQSLICPFGQVIRVETNTSKDFFIEGFTVYANKEAIKSGVEIDFNTILKSSSFYKEKFPNYKNNVDSSLLTRVFSSQLIPFDYLITVPGTFELMGYYFDLTKYPDLEANILLDETYRLSKGYDRLYTAGKIVTHFNHDPDFEKNLIIQNAVWICSSNLQMKAYKIMHINKSFKRVYLNLKNEKKDKDFNESIKTYYRILDKLGEESLVYLTPNDFERRPKCLPANVGLSPVSDNVRTPSLSSKRYPEKIIRNQAMLGIKNDCLPCTIAGEMQTPLKNFLMSVTIKSTQESIDEVWKIYSAKENLSILSEFDKLIDFKSDINLTTWLNDESIADSIKQKLTSEYLSYILKEEKIFFEKNYPQGKDQFEGTSNQLQFLADYFLDIYFLRDVKFSFDCCELNRIANPSFLDLSKQLSQFTDTFLANSIQKRFLLLNKEELSVQEQSDLVYIYSGIKLIKAINQLYRNLMFNTQTICLSGYEPGMRAEALEKVNSFSGSNISELGSYNYGKLVIPLPDNQEMEVTFGNCNCGKTRETHLPILDIEPGKTSLMENKNPVIPINLTPKFVLGATAGRLYMSTAGADKYHGGWINSSHAISVQLDSVLKEVYSYKYHFDNAQNYKFDWFSNYSVFAGYDFTNKIQARIHYTYMNGSSSALLPFSYYKDPGDTSTLKILNAYVLNRIKIIDFGLSARYYFMKTLRPFVGLGGSVVYFDNTSSKTYLEYIEIVNDIAPPTSAFAAFSELGLRFDFNQDFFIEALFHAQNRWDKDISNQSVTGFDYKILVGAGARF